MDPNKNDLRQTQKKMFLAPSFLPFFPFVGAKTWLIMNDYHTKAVLFYFTLNSSG